MIANIPPETDIRVIRLGVSIAKCPFLTQYYSDPENMKLASDYLGISFSPVFGVFATEMVNRQSLTIFLDRLYSSDPKMFSSFFTYTLRDIFRANGSYEDWGQEFRTPFDDFRKDLRALGFEITSTGVVPVVGVGVAEESQVTSALENMLADLNPSLVEMYRGAWEALLSGRADSDRQAIASARELLKHSLEILGGTGKWSEKISGILGGKDTLTVKAVANLVETIYSLQSKGTHWEPKYERALFVIKLTEHTLFYLLKSQPISHQNRGAGI